MIRNILHIILAAAVSLTPPGASMVEYTCDLTGATTQIVSTLGAGNHVDECCDDDSGQLHTFTSVADDCCRATVFSLPPTSPAPTQAAADATPALAPLHMLRPDVTPRMVLAREARSVSPPISRNLPLLI